MSDIITVFIEDNGDISFLGNTLAAGFNLGPTVIRRYSACEPALWYLRLVFHALRFVFGETGAVSDFTRSWRCLWRANIRGGPILEGRWYDRQEAINAEIKFFNENGIQ